MIRELKISEIKYALKFGEEMYSEAEMYGKFDREAFSELWIKLITRKDGVIFGLFHQRILVGGIGGNLYVHPFTGDLVSMALFWFVSKGHRGKSGMQLFKRLEDWAIERGAARISSAAQISLKPLAFKKIYNKLGLKPVEILFEKEI